MSLITLRTWLTTHPRHAATIGILVAAVIVLLVVYIRGRHDAHKHDEAARAVAVAEALKRDGQARDKVAEVREHDAQVNAQLREELTDAVSQVPDDVPDPVAVRLGCERLRAHGVSIANLPACR